MIRALIFDFDGLMVATEVPAFQSWQEIYRAHGHELSLDDWALCLGTSHDEFDPLTDLAARLGRPVDRAELERLRQSRKGVLAAEQQALPGVVEYLKEARRLGLKIGLASSSPHQWVEDHLQRLGLIGYFHTIKCAEDVLRVKPDPALYQAVLAALDVQSDEAIVLEDSPNGVRAANRAGIFCVAVPNALSSRLILDHADLRVASLADVPLAALIERVTELKAGRSEVPSRQAVSGSHGTDRSRGIPPSWRSVVLPDSAGPLRPNGLMRPMVWPSHQVACPACSDAPPTALGPPNQRAKKSNANRPLKACGPSKRS